VILSPLLGTHVDLRPVQPHWLTTRGGAVNRFTGRTQIRHFVMAITGDDSAAVNAGRAPPARNYGVLTDGSLSVTSSMGAAVRPTESQWGWSNMAAATLDEGHETRWFDKTLGTHIARVVTLN
jgi:hypothetical protein